MTSAIPQDEPLAHSARPKAKPPVKAQTYREHVENVWHGAVANAQRAVTFYAGEKEEFVRTVESAALFHDLGKLDSENQTVLKRFSRDALKIPHEDAGCAALKELQWLESVVLVAGHHAGLFSREAESRPLAFRRPEIASRTDMLLQNYLITHGQFCDSPSRGEKSPLHSCGLSRRLALSCLVDADHGDTARHYGGEPPVESPAGKWCERLAALDRYVANLPLGSSEREKQRNDLRRRMYDACRDADTMPSMRCCDAPVGSGKTTAIMAHLLQVAAIRNLRHIFVVLPYTNIIKQTVEVYRKALVLSGENPEEVVAEHHHQADFEDISCRQMATLWKSPVVVTTAVQFFETLGSNIPARLRKLHELPGSALFVDEVHATMPSYLWPQAWQWLNTWVQNWGGHVVLASGSLPRFWELPEFVGTHATGVVPDLVPHALRNALEAMESQRIRPNRKYEPFNCEGLIAEITSAPGPRLVIMNTVQSTAVLADRMAKAGHQVMHLSTALAPIHRDRIVDRVKERLKYGAKDWNLVATSCVEAGMDFSFRSGFRESCSTASLIQVGGRVNRHGRYSEAHVWDFRVQDVLFNRNPGFDVSRRVLDLLFNINAFENMISGDLAKEAMRREITEGDKRRAEELVKKESEMEYPDVAKLCRVIDSDCRLVVIDLEVISRLEKGERVQSVEMLRKSVQMWTTKIRELALVNVDGYAEVYKWTAPYDPDFLGYMAGVLPLVYAGQDGFYV
ncbi:MAG: CRISPR-associated protein [Candidatus Thermoplasmatota archaeon]|nr:CRISPR-associated protein [Candidatus Thermoplasmatota archaeon]